MTADEAFVQFPVLTTPRLTLRELEPGDTEAFFAILSNEEVMRYYGSAPHLTSEQTRDFIMRLHGWYTAQQGIRWGITRQGDARIIGTCGLFHFDEGFHRAEIGYDLHPDVWSQGIMNEAAKAVITYGFATLGLHRIEANIDMANARSQKLLLKLGFTYEGMLRERFVGRNGFEDEHYFGLLADEWQG
ncbi:MAG: GNAT family N-acetyltransferase [Ktedonobacterales bacterium]|nr:GNAT family N-acetyltransferase [Ktedonobacterales bacterium]